MYVGHRASNDSSFVPVCLLTRMCLILEKIRIIHRRMSYEQLTTLLDVNAVLCTNSSVDINWKINGYGASSLKPTWKPPFGFAKDSDLPSRYSFHNIFFRTVVSNNLNFWSILNLTFENERLWICSQKKKKKDLDFTCIHGELRILTFSFTFSISLRKSWSL